MNNEQAELELLRDQAPTAFEEAVRQLWPSVVKAKTNLTGGIEVLGPNGECLLTTHDGMLVIKGANGRSITINPAYVPDDTDLQLLGPLNIVQNSTGLTYALTTSVAAVTGSQGLILPEPGTWLIEAKVKLAVVGATFAAAQSVGALLTRTNNTPANLDNSGSAAVLPAMTTATLTGSTLLIGPTVYTTSNSNDAINVLAFISALPSAGAVQVSSVHILARRA